MNTVTCIAPVNIAVIKYWGKRDESLILPTNDSISATLDTDQLHAKTSVMISLDFKEDHIWLNGREEDIKNPRLQNCLKEIKKRSQLPGYMNDWKIHICSKNNFPTAAGLASSAAGYACLAAALAKLYKVEGDISVIARSGSGSACRSVMGGFVRWHMGLDKYGTDSMAKQIVPASHWPEMRILVLVVNEEQKKVSSAIGMKRSMETSQFLQYRITHTVPERANKMQQAIIEKDFKTFAELTMKDSNQMHAVCLDTYPPCVYMNNISNSIMNLIYSYNEAVNDVKVAYTFDAGSNATLYLLEKDVPAVMGVLNHFFPPLENVTIEYKKGLSVEEIKPAKDLLEKLKFQKHPPGQLKYIIYTKVGDGPKYLDSPQDHLLDSQGAKWHARRKILTPAFHFKILNQFADILINEGDRMTKSLKDVGGAVVKDLVPFVSEHTLNAICETAMGISLQKLNEFQQQYRNAAHDIIELIFYRAYRPWFYNDLLFSLSPQGRKQKKVLKILHGFTEKVIAERKLYHERTNDRYLKTLENDEETEIDDVEIFGIKKKRLALLDLLIAASRDNFLTDLDIKEEVETFMFGGHDTTAMSMTFALLLLAEHKDVQERVRVEVNTVMQENGGKFTMKSLQDLEYLDRCLKETLRLYTIAPSIIRRLEQDVKLHSYVIPAGTNLHLNFYGVHRDPNFWSNPEVFDADRFLPERIWNRHLYSYLPFSAGSRNCIGQRFALVELKAMMASLVHNFYLEPVDCLKHIRLKTDIVIRPSHPVHIKFIPISRK